MPYDYAHDYANDYANQYIVTNSFINVDNLNYSKQFNKKTVLLTDPNETFVNNLGY